MKRIISVAMLAIVLSFSTAHAQIAEAPDVPLQEKPVAEIVQHFAALYGVSASQMLSTIQCESSTNPAAVGDHNQSFGIVQIYLPAHPEITKNEALSPLFSIEWMAQQFAKGNQKEWSCTKILGY